MKAKRKTKTKPAAASDETFLDVLIIGAGVSGIGVAGRLLRELPHKRLMILERRAQLGGTWDLFRYPGIRSDSDMFTFSYDFKPWTEPRMLADADSILRYLRDTARETGVDRLIRYRQQALRADWSSTDARWTVEVRDEDSGALTRYRARFLVSCAGYYRQDAGFRPDFPGEAAFKGRIVHPQHWPADLDYSGQRVVVIGSGATAATLVPSMTDRAAHVTMLQRSPGYFLSIPAIDPITRTLQNHLPEQLAFFLTRARNTGLQRGLWGLSKRHPDLVSKLLLGQVRRQLAGKVDMRHFTPSYRPWEQRLCVLPDGDLFRMLREGRASVVTDEIENFTAGGISLKSGQHLDADLIVTATGLNMELLGGVETWIDGVRLAVGDRMLHKGVMIEGVPNAALIFGYINYSWTLKVNLAAVYLCRLLRHLDRHGHGSVTAKAPADAVGTGTMVDGLRAGYIRRASGEMPRQGRHGPWVVRHDFHRDALSLRYGPIEDGALVFDEAASA